MWQGEPCGAQQALKVAFNQRRRLAEQLLALHMEQKIAVVHPGTRVTACATGADFTQIAAFRIGFHQVGQNPTAPIAAFHNGTGGTITKNQ
ncbi:hypothetical protein D3C80_2022690 [compost metagenome]